MPRTTEHQRLLPATSAGATSLMASHSNSEAPSRSMYGATNDNSLELSDSDVTASNDSLELSESDTTTSDGSLQLSESDGATSDDSLQLSHSNGADDVLATLIPPNATGQHQTFPDAGLDGVEQTQRSDADQTPQRTTTDRNAPAPRDGMIGSLTRRLRCLFSAITWPIVPLGTLVAFTLLWVLYTASSIDMWRACSQPMHLYALASLILVIYIPQHAQIRSSLFGYTREHDGPIRPIPVRVYDQTFHTICILYVYAGVNLLQVCREDVLTPDSEYYSQYSDMLLADDDPQSDVIPPVINTCEATCPNLYQALSIYVTTLEMFTFALILPLLFLPCIYLWFRRRASADADSMTQRFHDDASSMFRPNNPTGITTAEILDSLERVQLISDASQDSISCVVISSPTPTESKSIEFAKECCICMCDFPVTAPIAHGLDVALCDVEDGDQHDATTTVSDSSTHSATRTLLGPLLSFGGPQESQDDDEKRPKQWQRVRKDAIVRTKCGHIFHEECLVGWIGGNWQLDPNLSPQARARHLQYRPAQQTCCPLCREDLRPHESV